MDWIEEQSEDMDFCEDDDELRISWPTGIFMEGVVL
jgi:hypothetical protein